MDDITAQLTRRLRLAADELASAANYGIPVPAGVSVTGYDLLEGLTLSLDCLSDFDAWVAYASDVVVEEYDHADAHWHRATGSLGFEGLRVSFAVSMPMLKAVSV